MLYSDFRNSEDVDTIFPLGIRAARVGNILLIGHNNEKLCVYRFSGYEIKLLIVADFNADVELVENTLHITSNGVHSEIDINGV